MTVTITLPDPAALSWEERADLKIVTGDAIRAVTDHERVAVDILPESDDD